MLIGQRCGGRGKSGKRGIMKGKEAGAAHQQGSIPRRAPRLGCRLVPRCPAPCLAFVAYR